MSPLEEMALQVFQIWKTIYTYPALEIILLRPTYSLDGDSDLMDAGD